MPRDPEKRFRKLNRPPKTRKLERSQIAAMFPTGAAAEIAFVDNIPEVGAAPIVLPIGNPTDGQGYQDCSSLPLFGPNSPNLHDIMQGYTPDCYAIVCFGGMALCNPESVKNQVRRVGDKFYVRFVYAGQDTWLEMDGQLPSGAGIRWIDDIWAPLYEKGYAYWRTRLTTKQFTYASLGWGNPVGETGPLAAIGWSNVGYIPSASSWGLAATAILENRPCFVLTRATIAAGVPLIGSHAYNLVGVNADGTLTAFNPWGSDGIGSDSNPSDGLVTFTQAQGLANLSYLVIGTKYNPPAAFPVVTPAPPPAPPRKYNFADFVVLSNHYGQSTTKGAAEGDFNGDGKVDFLDYTILSNNWDTAAGALPPPPSTPEKPMPTVDLKIDTPGGSADGSWQKPYSPVNWTFVASLDTTEVTVNGVKQVDAQGRVKLAGSGSINTEGGDAVTINVIATGPGGNAPASRVVTVKKDPTPTPTPTPTPSPTPTPTPTTTPASMKVNGKRVISIDNTYNLEDGTKVTFTEVL